MNHCGVENKCDKKAAARVSASQLRPEKRPESRTEEWTIMEGTSLCLPIVILLMQCK